MRVMTNGDRWSSMAFDGGIDGPAPAIQVGKTGKRLANQLVVRRVKHGVIKRREHNRVACRAFQQCV
jgi:hypothetical protein